MVQLDCKAQRTRFLNLKKYKSLSECTEENIHCQLVYDKFYMAECNLTEKRIGTICVPYCFSEFSSEQLS